MRLFVGIDLPEALRKKLGQLIAQLRPLAAVRWSRAENLHITTKFIGEWPDARLDEMKQALSRIAGPAPFEIALNGLGWFPNPHQPRIFWIGVAAPPDLAALSAETETVVERLGVPRENRPFSPHLTLARLDGIHRPELIALRQAVAQIDSAAFGAFTAESFHLYLSKTGPGGSHYTKLATYQLGASSK